jgi:hypothetical protein
MTPPSTAILHLAQKLFQLIEATIPALHMPVSIFQSYEKRLVKVHRSFSTMLFER